MLDDLKLIHSKDSNDTLGTASKQYQQVLIDYSLNLEKKHFSNIVLARCKEESSSLMLSCNRIAFQDISKLAHLCSS